MDGFCGPVVGDQVRRDYRSDLAPLWQNGPMSWAHRLDTSKPIRLTDFSTKDNDEFNKEGAQELIKKYGEELDELEDLQFFAGTHALLIVLQGMDAAGKDGTIRAILKQSNSQGGHVWGFKVPSAEELAHDYLWRVHKRTPAKGEFAIFNRSHYEDVLVVRVHSLAPQEVWSKRYDQINDFERLLAANNTIVVKFFLHISREEQEERLLAREQETEKAWKLSVGDWKERAFWNDYQEAYEDVLSKCSHAHAPWYVVPADKKWFRDAAILRVLVETLRPYREEWMASLARVGEEAKAELREFRSS